MRAAALRRAVLLLSLVLGAGGCGDLTVPGDERPVGLVVLDEEGAEVASFDSRTGAVSGELRVPAGGTRTFRVLLTDRAGGRTAPGEAGLTLFASAVDTRRATVGVDGGQLTVQGGQVGKTAVNLSVLEGGVSILAAFVPVSVRAG